MVPGRLDIERNSHASTVSLPGNHVRTASDLLWADRGNFTPSALFTRALMDGLLSQDSHSGLFTKAKCNSTCECGAQHGNNGMLQQTV